MTKRRRILHTDIIIQNVVNIFCLLMFWQLKGFYSVAINPVLLYSTGNDIRVANMTKPGKVNTILKGLDQGSAVDYLYKRNLICWSDQTAELIQCMNYNDTHSGEKMRIVSEGLITPTGIAIDWYTDKIYWTDGDTNRLEVISIDQKYRKVLFWAEVDLARAIAVVPKEGLLFWTDWGEIPKIERAGMNGDPTTRKVIVKENIFWPNGITIDYNNNLIYWVDAKLMFVDVMDFNGEKRKRIIKGGLEYPYALTFFNDKLYWTDWKTWKIYTWDMSTNGPMKDLIKSDPVPVDIRVYDSRRQLDPPADHPCRVNNGGCSHLCLLAPNPPGYTCSCPTGVKLREGSNTTCYSTPQCLLLVAQRSAISKISLDSPDFTPYTLPLKDLKRAMSVDFDPKTEYIYWTDSMAKTISRARLDGSEQSVVIHSGGVPDSIAIDPLARNIYWTDPVTDTISVARLDGSVRKVVIYEDLYEPRAIAVHPTGGWMFWSDWYEKRPKIERSALDGSGRVLLVSEKLMWPNGIALDTVNNKLYWGDARTHKIEVCNMDGTNRNELHNSDILHIFGLTLLDQHLYWSDMQRRTLDRIDKDTGLERHAVVEQMANMMGVKAFRLGSALGWDACAEHNGGCSHLCFHRPPPLDYVCRCPLGLELKSDKKTCTEPEALLIYSRKNFIGLLSMEYDNADNHALLPLKELKEVSALAVHFSGSRIYWSDSKAKTISRCSINGSHMEKILESMGLVEGLTIDWSAQNMYWTDSAAQRIEVARLDGSSRRTLIWQYLKKPKSITLDPKKGYMYWSELGSKTIKRAAMDGSSPTVLVDQVGKVHALALDSDRRTLYWAALEPPTIEYAFLNGTGRKVLVDNITMPYALTLFGDRVFWGDWNTGVIQSVKKTDVRSRTAVHSRPPLDYLSDLAVLARAGAGNQCGVDNGGCAHLCLPLPPPAGAGAGASADYRCACPTHYKLNKDNQTCSEPEDFLLFAQKNAIGRLMIVNGECNDASIPVTGLKNVKAIEYDPDHKMLYWMDEDSHSIRRVPMSYYSTSAVSDSSTVAAELSRPFHMVLDVLGRALYWTCFDTDSINATSIENNSSAGVILRGKNMMPRHLAFHQTKRILIWNDLGLGAIMRSRPDGTGRTEIARAANATALTVDQAAGVVYWAVNKQIHAVDLDSNNKRIIWQGGWAGSLAVYGGLLYLSGGERLMRVAPHRRDLPAAPVPHLARPPCILAVTKPMRTHPCYGGRACGGAPGACGARGACGCGPACRACAPGAFACRPPAQSVAPAPAPPAPPVCVPDEWRCDGQADCPNGADEEGCGCAAGLRCADGSCAESLGDCATGAYCAPPDPPLPDAFRCDERLCLGARLLCDGAAHCEDGADEAPAHCGPGPPTSTRSSNAFAVCGGIAGLAGALALLWAALRRWRRRAPPYPGPPPVLVPLKQAVRARPLGASATISSDSLCRYPLPTANPPPSPATASGGGGGGAGGGGGGAGAGRSRRAYRHYRAMNRPPPPTPASTDAAESEPEHARAPPPSPDPNVCSRLY